VEDFLQRLRQRKIVQWAIAYAAFWFALLQGVDIVAARFEWPAVIERCFILALAIGFCATLVLAWYHGERGAQRIGGMEIMILALLLAIGGGLLWRFGPATVPRAHAPAVSASPAVSAARPATVAVQPIPAKSIAVLPFENLSSDKDNAYFASGIQDLILTKLADVGDLKVISRTSTEKYTSRPDDLKAIGQQLGVATILEGSVQKAGNEVLVNVQLIDSRTDSHVWAQDYTRTLDNIFGVEGDVAEKVAAALKARLSPAQSEDLAAVLTTNPVAYDAFLRAEFQANLGDTNYDTASWKAAIALYRQAVRAEPGFARAWARLSAVESVLGWHGGGGNDVQQLARQARVDAEQAMKLAPDLAASRLALGYCEYYGSHDYPAALEAFVTVLKLAPNDANALKAQGFVQRRLGRFDDAIASLVHALVFDPRNSVLAYELGSTYAMASRYPEAEQAFQRALAIDPGNSSAKAGYADAILHGSGDVARALAEVQDDPALKLDRYELLLLQRKYPEALALLDDVPDTLDNFDAVLGSKNQQKADLFRLMGDDVRARALFAQDLPQAQAQTRLQDGILLAAAWGSVANDELGLGHTRQAMAALAEGQGLVDAMHDQVNGPIFTEGNAVGYAQMRRADLAVPLLARVFASPGIGGFYSPVMLWLDPYWDPIRHDPRFQALQQKYAKYKPAVTYDAPPVTSGTSSATAR
jgi:TolB-like protein/Tfp pilus assembly protein PilF